MTLGESIRDLRKQNNMSQEQLAEKLDVSRQSVSLWEKDATQPTIDNIITLSDIFGVTVDELLKSNAPLSAAEKTITEGDDHSAPKGNTLSKKQLVIAALDVLVFAAGIYMIHFLKSGAEDFFTVLDLHFSSAAVTFIMLSPVVIGILTALWLAVGVLVFVKKKPFKVSKTILIMLGLTMFIAANIVGGITDNRRDVSGADEIPSGVSYLDLRAFESIDTLSEYDEQYQEGQTDSEIPVNYAVMQDYLGNTAYTKCVQFAESDDEFGERERYYSELEGKYGEELDYLTDTECRALGIDKCAYNLNAADNCLSLYIIKGERVYYCSYTNLSEINDTVREQIKNFA